MPILNILQYPDSRLRLKAAPVANIDDNIRNLVADMLQTMWEANGIGLAATQVDVQQRIIVMDLLGDRSNPRVFINAEVDILDETPRAFDEGCLSIPEVVETVERPSKVIISALNGKGEWFKEEAEGLLAVCIQHEIDHLDGKLFVDYLSSVKRQRIRKHLKKNRT
ncbi:MAG: peptide deformylase [Cellvibrionales bacterium TMED49]|nr:peptide deformylase [Porticoccaceae bacterium]OUU38446.1 MAG: peptide deformylase [Cellvibrionales bacterium TMED49]